MKKSPQKIEMKLVETNFFTRWPCTACGGVTEKVPILCEGFDGASPRVRVCEHCIEAGDIDARLQQNAAQLDRYAAYVRSLVGRLEVPSYAKYKAADAAYDAAFDAFDAASTTAGPWEAEAPRHATSAKEDFNKPERVAS